MPTIPINDDTTRDEYTATGGQTTFAYTFWIKDEAHLDVYQNGTLLTLTTHYTVSGTQSDTGANVVLVTGATVNDEIVIAYNPDVERLSEFTTSGTFTAAALNLELSYIISLLQYLDTERARAIAFAADDTSGVSPTIPSGLAAGEMLQVNSGGTALQRVLPADLDLTSVSAFMATVMDDATAADARTTLDAQQLDATLTALAGWANGTDKIPYTTATDTVASLDFLDEDAMGSDSATAVASQQSIKAYADTKATPALDNLASVAINTSLISDTTNTDDLGSSSITWKDLYLGGGMYLGGTGSANYMTDYEEGTWTATLNGSSANPSTPVTVTSYYTKIGRFVNIRGYFANVNTTGASGGIRITGLPFSIGSSLGGASGNVNVHTGVTITANTANLTPWDVAGDLAIYQALSNAAWSEAAHNAGTGRYLAFSYDYYV